MDYSVFIDESYNTGEPKFNNGKWNFYDQPYFILGSFIIKDEYIEEFRDEFKKKLLIYAKYEKGLGTTKELKSTTQYKFRNELLNDMIELIKKYKIELKIDVSNKKYKIITTLVDYCIYPYYIYNIENKSKYRTEIRECANYLYYELDDDILSKYVNLCNDKERENIEDLSDFMNDLYSKIRKNKIKEEVKEVINYIDKYEQKKLKIQNLFPLKDLNNRGKIMSFLPNLDAYNNVIASISRLSLSKNDSIYIYHDVQKQFSNSITKWTDRIKTDTKNIDNIKFIESKDEILIQFIDYITGNFRICFNNIMNGTTKKRDREFIKLLKDILLQSNIVSTKNNQEKFFNAIGTKPIYPQLPYK